MQSGLFDIMGTDDENAEEGKRTVADNRNGVHGYAGAEGTFFAEN